MSKKSKCVQLRRGTAEEHETFVGAIGEVTVDTTNNTLRVHDGVTPGGHAAGGSDDNTTLPDNIDYVAEWQLPSAENAYTWYRKYQSGWVEMGGIWTGSKNCEFGREATITLTLPLEMKDNNYYATAAVSNTYLMHMGQNTEATSVMFRFGAYSTTRTLN